ncbi:helix-turn-helix domain-containing protein [Salmonella enterica]|uniref:helix-turn-helix domain-containing protein n=1 Tax=Salmonella enterica TaxID=28901 RepID=UPI00398C2C0F
MQSRLRKLRKSNGYTLKHVARGVQVDPATLGRVERCGQAPSKELAESLAQFYAGEISGMQILYANRYQLSDSAI